MEERAGEATAKRIGTETGLGLGTDTRTDRRGRGEDGEELIVKDGTVGGRDRDCTRRR